MTAAPRRPYGFWGSTLCVLAACIASIIATFVAISVYSAVVGKSGPPLPDEYLLVLICLIILGVLAFAAKMTGWPLKDYFAFVMPPAIYIAAAVGGEAVITVADNWLLSFLGGGEVNVDAVKEGYRAAQRSGLVPLYLINTVLLAPFTEEIMFRGFLLPSWNLSRLRPAGAIIATSILFAALHVQYDWRGMIAIGAGGLLYGWLRWRSGSIIPPLVGHCAGNAFAVAMIVVA